MFTYLRNRWGEVSTYYGFGALGVATVMLVMSFMIRFDIGSIFRDIGKPLAAAGLIGILMPDKKKPRKPK